VAGHTRRPRAGQIREQTWPLRSWRSSQAKPSSSRGSSATCQRDNHGNRPESDPTRQGPRLQCVAGQVGGQRASAGHRMAGRCDTDIAPVLLTTVRTSPRTSVPEIVVVSEACDEHLPWVQRDLRRELVVVDPPRRHVDVRAWRRDQRDDRCRRRVGRVWSVWYRKPLTMLRPNHPTG
jgi:hypothetical protein